MLPRTRQLRNPIHRVPRCRRSMYQCRCLRSSRVPAANQMLPRRLIHTCVCRVNSLCAIQARRSKAIRLCSRRRNRISRYLCPKCSCKCYFPNFPVRLCSSASINVGLRHRLQFIYRCPGICTVNQRLVRCRPFQDESRLYGPRCQAVRL